jgi:tRNA/rRNA methyltransferase
MHFTFILVEPKVPENIGASARALKTMGFDSLRLINPCPYIDGKAKWVAHGAYDILENSVVYPSLKDAITDLDLVIGTTARYRLVKKEYISLNKLQNTLEGQFESTKRVGIVFGREESGLTNEEIQICDLTTSIPLKEEFPSLNLSQAVMIYAYELSNLPPRLLNTQSKSPPEVSVKALKSKIDLILAATGIKENDALHGRIMERVALASDIDIKLIHSVATALLKEIGYKN